MSQSKEKPGPRGRGNVKKGPTRPSLLYRIGRLMVEHPRGVLIGAATLLGLIVVLANWRSTEAKLLIWTVSLPFIVWALIFMLVGFLTGKWIEWAIQQRRIRKGTFKPRQSADELADASADLEGRLNQDDEPDPDEPATIIDRGEGKRPAHQDSGPVEQVDYWEEPSGQADPDSSSGPHGKYSPAAEGAAGDAPGNGPGKQDDRGFREYRDYSDSGRYGDYGESGRYGDYGDYQDSGGRYGDYQDSGGRYGDYQDSGGRRGGRKR